VPLTRTKEDGAAVAGVRFRARKLNATLHPTVPIHAPLVFNLIDTWQGISIGECTYHVLPPDGRLYPARPANVGEAETRRTERFLITGARPKTMAVPDDEANLMFPLTLDLRRQPPQRGAQAEMPELVL
jgi:uncharacterized protein (DUF2126 family)